MRYLLLAVATSLGGNIGFDEYRSRGTFLTGAGSGHFNIQRVMEADPRTGLSYTSGNMHVGEHNPFSPIGFPLHCLEDGACY